MTCDFAAIGVCHFRKLKLSSKTLTTTKPKANLHGGVRAVVARLTEQVALAIGPPVARKSPIRDHSPLVCPPTPHLRPHLVSVRCAPPVTRHVLRSLCSVCSIAYHNWSVSALPITTGWCQHCLSQLVGVQHCLSQLVGVSIAYHNWLVSAMPITTGWCWRSNQIVGWD